MNEKAPHLPSRPPQGGEISSAERPITEHNSETLRAHIASGKIAEERTGFFAENMTFNAEKAKPVLC
jgi:hypothetical protein